jgi:hypothetical protein
MALTDKSTIPLTVNDLRVVGGERCFLDRRINLRLGYGRDTEVRDLIRRNKDDFERRWGNLRHRAANYPGAGRPTEEYWLTKGQALWVCRKSDARNADDVMEEIIKVFLAVDAGAQIPDTPWTDALFSPDRPTIERGDGNIVHIVPQKDLFEPPAPTPQHEPDHPFWCAHEWSRLPLTLRHRWWKETDYDRQHATPELIAECQAVLDLPITGGQYQPTFDLNLYSIDEEESPREQWHEEDEGLIYVAAMREEQGPPFLKLIRMDHTSTAALNHFFLPSVPQITLCYAPNVPRAIVDKALARIGLLTPIVTATLDKYFE